MNCYRPTTLKLATSQCPRAVDYYEKDVRAFREHFQVGIAGHEVLAAIGMRGKHIGRPLELGEMATISADVVRALITKGRAFESRAEPPMPMEDAQAGADLALTYASAETTVWSQTASYEIGLAFDSQWRQVPYDSHLRRFRLILDVLDVVDDAGEEYTGRVAVVRDYKSAWSTDARELETFQMKAQAVAAWLTVPDTDCVRREVVNLRSGATFSEELWLESGGREQIEEWRRDITVYMKALDDMIGPDGRRPLRPGAGCYSCPWSLHCDDSELMGTDIQLIGQRLALIEGQRAQCIKALKLADIGQPLLCGDSAVGWKRTADQVPADGAARTMYEAWTADGGEINGFLAALKPGMGALRAVAKMLNKDDKEAEDALVSEWSKTKLGREFTIWKAGK